MAEALTIDIELQGVAAVTGGLRQAATATRNVDRAQRMQAASARDTAKNLSDSLRIRRQQVQLQSSEVRLAQQQLRLSQQQKKTQGGGANPIQNQQGGFAQNLMRAVMSSRVSLGGGNVMPLVSNVVKLLGEGGTLAAGALGGLSEAAKQASEMLRDFRQAMFTSGGTGAETARLGSLGSAVGIGQGEMANISREIAEGISSGGPASAYAARAGAYDLPGSFGATDKTKNLFKIIDELRRLPESEAIRTARAIPGAEPLLRFRDLSAETMRQLKQDAQQRASIFTPGRAREAAEFQAQLGRASQAFENLLINAIAPLIPAATKLAAGFAKIVNWIADRIPDMDNTITDALNSGFSGHYAGRGAKKAAEVGRDSALEENTSALRGVSAALKNGIYGGGERARGAIPGKWTGMNSRMWIGQSTNLGAFSL